MPKSNKYPKFNAQIQKWKAQAKIAQSNPPVSKVISEVNKNINSFSSLNNAKNPLKY